MPRSLRDTISEPLNTESAIRQALYSIAGLSKVWVVVEAEDDVSVYEKFVQEKTTEVKTSSNETGRKGYANVEHIVNEIKKEVPSAHIIGIRDSDYSRYVADFKCFDNVFLTDHRDLEMMLLDAKSVKQSFYSWISSFDDVLLKCMCICKHFGCLRIYNEINSLHVKFRGKLGPNNYWNFECQDMKSGWIEGSIDRFVELSNGRCTSEDIHLFIKRLVTENVYDICRGHDVVRLLSLYLIDVQTYSEQAIMNHMIEAYALDDFKVTKLYSAIKAWQKDEDVVVLKA